MIDHIFIKDIHQEYAKCDGRRILVEKNWLPGFEKDAFKIDDWVNNLAPSTALINKASREAKDVREFVEAYWLELEMNIHFHPFILGIQEYKIMTLVHNQNSSSKLFAKVLKDYIDQVLLLYKVH